MALRDYLPKKDADLLAWSANFGALIVANFAAYGIPQLVATAYTAKQADFATKLADATNPLTRGKRTVFLKDESKRTLVTATRQIAKQITGMMTVTDAQRQELGITVPSGSRTPVPPPDSSPFIQVTRTEGRTVTIELRQSSTRRGRPAKVAGATVFTFTGPDAPQSVDDWKFATATSKTTVSIPFGPSATGETVWFTAFWTNAKNESGPAANAISVNLPAGGVLPGEVNEAPVRRAA